MYQLAGRSLACHSLHSPGVTEQHWQETASFYSPVCDHEEREVVFSLRVCILKKPLTFIPDTFMERVGCIKPQLWNNQTSKDKEAISLLDEV